MKNQSNKSIQFISEVNDIIYVHVNTPSAWDALNNKYVTMTDQNLNQGLNFHKTITMLIHKDSPDIIKLNNMITELSQGLKKQWNSPLKLFEDENNLELHENYYMINFKSKHDFTIRIVDSLKQPFDIKDGENYKGRIIGILSQYTTGTSGVTGYLKAIQLVSKSELKIGKSVIDLFDEIKTDSKEEEELPF